MNKLTEALTNANIPVPSKDTETFKIIRWGRNNRYWLKKFDGGYVFGDVVGESDDEIILDTAMNDESYGTSGTLEQ